MFDQDTLITVTVEDMCKELSELADVKPMKAFIFNKDTKELRFYTRKNPKTPKDWTNCIKGNFETPVYPDYTEPYNFTKFINVQWDLFGSIGPQYFKIDQESFEAKYLFIKIQAIKMHRNYGGSSHLDNYLKTLRETKFDYPLPMEVLDVIN